MSALHRTDRRQKLLGFIQPWIDTRPDQYRLSAGRWNTLPLSTLTNEALEQFAGRIVSDFWLERRLNRENRAIWAHQREVA